MPAPSPETRRLTALRIVDPPAFFSQVNGALRASTSVLDAAEKLRVSHATLKRWIHEDAGLVAGCDLRGPGNPALVKAHSIPPKKREGVAKGSRVS